MKKQFNEAQRQAIAHFTGPCLTLAGPGSGKTTVIVERICRLLEQGVPARNILVLTFTRAAAVEMRERFLKRIEEKMAQASSEEAWAVSRGSSEAQQRLLTARQVLFGTFHSAFFQILRYSGGYDASSVLRGEEKYAFLEEVSRAVGIYHDREGWYQEVQKEISDVKGNAMEPEDFHPLSCTSKEFSVLYRGYQDLLTQRKKLDFDDMLLRCLHLFEERPDILEIWQERCQFVLIDEYQDSSLIQCRLAQMLAAPQNNIMVVGDDDQSIYGFRGAAPERLRDFLAVYPDAKQYLLNINYRCPETVVKAAGKLIGENRDRLSKKILAAKTILNAEEVTITAEEYSSLLEENEAVIARIQSCHAAGVPYENMAVLYRINRNPAQLLRLLETRGIPVQVKGTAGGSFHHWICQDFCSYLAAANGSTRRSDWLRVISHPERYFSRSALGQEPVTLDRLFDYYSDDRRRIDTLDHLSYDMTLLRKSPPYAGLSHLRRYMGYDDYLEENDKSGESRLQEIAEQLQETADGCRTGLEWLAYVEKMRQDGNSSATMTNGRSHTGAAEAVMKNAGYNTPSGVHFMTMHSAKGLEFPIVFIVDANEGMTPYKRADSPEGIEEERRLFYVAMTRAKERLHISWTKERFHRPQSVSRFVSEAGLRQAEPKKMSWRERLGR